ncbi:MAG: acetyl-CoA carboxylase biotin carboxyl carrier protein [Steroidobacteraceae bacterium]|jgi:acetyl-CoA carboxylase biotin carboxyl carrier protein
MDIRKIKKLIELLEESGVAEIEIKEGEESLRISRMSKGIQVSSSPIAPLPAPAAAAAPLSAPAAAAAPSATTAAAGEQIVTAPMVGTYYSSPSPGAKEFISIGDEIKAGQVLCIIEAMKMMNQIESETDGTIRAILVKNGEPVEFGQPLFIVA